MLATGGNLVRAVVGTLVVMLDGIVGVERDLLDRLVQQDGVDGVLGAEPRLHRVASENLKFVRIDGAARQGSAAQ